MLYYRSIYTITYYITGLFAAIGITSLVSLLNALLLIALVLLSTWSYCRYTGELREIGTKIDEFAQIIWEMVCFN